MISFGGKGDFRKTEKFLKKSLGIDYRAVLHQYGAEGVRALQSVTPVDTGKTRDSWSYEINQNDGKISIVWKNSNVVDGVNVAVILQYGHGTRTGAYVEGIDYINPVLRPIFEKIAEAGWKEVTKE